MNQTSEIKLFNKTTVLVSSAFLSPFFGALLYSSNLYRINKRNEIWISIAAAVAFNLVITKVNPLLGGSLFSLIPLNLIASLFITHFLWKDQIGEDIEYKSRPIWIPLCFIIVIYSIFIGLNFLKR